MASRFDRHVCKASKHTGCYNAGVASDQGKPAGPAGLTFGEELKKEREIRGISLAEIAEATKISKRFLGAIEKNDFESLPAPVFTRGFVREYARYLGLNAEDMVNRYAHYMDSEGKIAEDDPLPMRSSDHVPTSAPGHRGAGRRWGIVALVVTAAALALAGWLTRDRWKAERARPADSGETSTVSSSPPAAVPAATPSSPQPMTLTVTASEDVWIVLNADGQKALNGILGAGEERTFSADEQFEFETIGNAGGIAVSLEGRPLPPLGTKGEVVRNRVISRDEASSGRTPAPSP